MVMKWLYLHSSLGYYYHIGDDWLDMTEEDLESMLKNSATPSHPTKASQGADSADFDPGNRREEEEERVEEAEGDAADLQSMAYGMTAFVDKVSSHVGAEFPW